MSALLLIIGILIGGGGVFCWHTYTTAKIKQLYVLVPRNTLGQHLEISTGGGELMCPHCNGLLQETTEAALLINTKHPNQAEVKVYRHFATKHPFAEAVEDGAKYIYQDFIFPLVVPAATQREIKSWVLASKIGKSSAEWIDNNTMRVWDPLIDLRTGQVAEYPESRRYLDHQRMTAGLERILGIANLTLYDPKKEDLPLLAPVVTVGLSKPQ